MNRNSSIALLGAVFAVSVGLMGANGVFSMPTDATTSSTSYQEHSGNLLGHVTIVATDSNGNVKAYRQMDNVVTNVGRTCTAQNLFGYDAAHSSNQGNCAQRTSFQYIGIGSLSRTEVTSDTGLDSPIAVSSLSSPTLANPSTRTSYSLANSTGATGSVATSSVTYLFGATTTVGEVTLQDAATTASSTEHTFARKALSSTVGVNAGDTLTVTWTITTG